MSRAFLFYFLGFVSCALIVVLSIASVFYRENHHILKFRKQSTSCREGVRVYDRPLLSDQGMFDINEKLLPPDVDLRHIVLLKQFFSDQASMAIVGRTVRAPGIPSWSGVIVLTKDFGWQKYLEIDPTILIKDFWWEGTPGLDQILHLVVKLDNGAGSGEGTIMELTVKNPNEAPLNIVRCGYHADDMGTLSMYTKGTDQKWYSLQLNKLTGKEEREIIPECQAPAIKFYGSPYVSY